MRSMPGVKHVGIEGVDGWQRLTIEAERSADVREEVFRMASDRGWGLRELRREVASLEDFFIKITAQQRAEAEA